MSMSNDCGTAPSCESPGTPTESAMRELRTNMDNLESNLHFLKDRLKPVLMAEPPQETKNTADCASPLAQPVSPLVLDIERAGNRVHNFYTLVEEVIARLQV